MKTLNEIRDAKAQAHYDRRAKLFDVNEFDRETIAIESYKIGFDASTSHHQKIIAGLVSALEDIADYSDESSAYLRAQDQKWAAEALAAYKSIVTPITTNRQESVK